MLIYTNFEMMYGRDDESFMRTFKPKTRRHTPATPEQIENVKKILEETYGELRDT